MTWNWNYSGTTEQETKVAQFGVCQVKVKCLVAVFTVYRLLQVLTTE